MRNALPCLKGARLRRLILFGIDILTQTSADLMKTQAPNAERPRKLIL